MLWFVDSCWSLARAKWIKNMVAGVPEGRKWLWNIASGVSEKVELFLSVFLGFPAVKEAAWLNILKESRGGGRETLCYKNRHYPYLPNPRKVRKCRKSCFE